MNYSAIHIQGNIISSEILEKIRTEDTRFQKPVDFGLHPNTPVRDEINLAWSIAVTSWNAFRMKRENLNDTDSGTTDTRRYWMLPLLQQILGFEISTSTAEIINGKSYAISHRATNRDGFPIHIVGINQSLDKRPETGGTRLSPHALVQEYLNSNEHLYALVSNGQTLRLLRDATRLSRLSYLEFDLEQMMEQGLYVEFALMYRTIHATRMPLQKESGAESMMEFYHQEALASGSRIRERLSGAVENSIKELANGLLHHPNNEELRQWVLQGRITPKEYYLYTLRLVYRILFLLVIEERKLIYGEKLTEEQSKKRDIYYRYYSIQRLTRLAEKLIYVDPRKNDLWQSLITTFALFEYQEYGSKLGIQPLGSGLFAPDALGELKHQMLSNENLLRVLRYLVTFENENRQRVRVNYADLDVEEFGSVYEGLLEYDPEITDNAGQPIFGFVAGSGRSSSGSHYTPEELVKPLITHSLDYLIADRLKEADPEAALLSLTICDVACGSGHILLSAARRVGFELAKVRSGEDQPTPTAMRMAVRDVISHCIYGVDLNPLAVELCKVALWLEAHEPGQPLNFLDHRIKCGDAIVGLAHRSELENGIADEAFKTLPGDDKIIAKALRDQNIRERKARNSEGQQVKADFDKTTNDSVHEAIAEYKTFNQQPETTPEEIERKARAYKKFLAGKGYKFMKNLADTQVAQFFIPKTKETEKYISTDAEYRLTIKGYNLPTGDKFGKIEALAQEKAFFHWFLEFPEVFAETDTEQGRSGGFDCILGNPPFIAGRDIKQKVGDQAQSFIFHYNTPCEGRSDLVAYFFRRSYKINNNGFISLISTNTISQGETRTTGIEFILSQGAQINAAYKSIPWPGKAGVTVSLITINNQKNRIKSFLNGKEVKYINSRIEETKSLIELQPMILFQNKDLAFQGSILYGEGFKIDNEQANDILNSDDKYKNVISDFLTGDDLNDDYSQKPSEIVINFRDWSLEKAADYPLCLSIVESKVKPDREKKNDQKAKEKWWIYLRSRIESYNEIALLNYVLVNAVVSKYPCFIRKKSDIVFSNKNTIFKINNYKEAILHSTLYNSWIFSYSTTLGASTLNFSIDECFNNFPFPQNLTANQEQKLEEIGEAYHEHRRQLMLRMQLGLTKTYNAFHAKEIQEQRMKSKDLEGLDKKAIEKKYGKEVWNLWNHLQKLSCPVDDGTSAVASVCSFEEAIAGIVELRRLHVLMDEAVLEAYGWSAEVRLRHDFYEVDYLPENDRVRYTIHPDARKEILKRLLELNHKIHEEEVEAGLWEKKKTSAKKASKKVSGVLKEPEVGYGGLFDGVEE